MTRRENSRTRRGSGGRNIQRGKSLRPAPFRPTSDLRLRTSRFFDVAVIGAGAFGGWTAWHLARRGARVVLVDAWGAGHPRGTSSGEARILRFSYGEKHLYSEWTHRARTIWKKDRKSVV